MQQSTHQDQAQRSYECHVQHPDVDNMDKSGHHHQQLAERKFNFLDKNQKENFEEYLAIIIL